MKEELLKGLTQEQIAKIKACKNQEELLALAKAKAEPKVEKTVKDLKRNLSDFLQNLSDKLED